MGRYLFFILILILSSCALFERRKLVEISEGALEKKLSALCLTGQGRGRLEYGERSFPFSYEAWRGQDDGLDHWSLVMDFSFHGEELLKLTWDAQKPPVFIGGSFRTRMMNKAIYNIAESHELPSELVFAQFQSIASGIRWLLETEKKCQRLSKGQFSCQGPEKKRTVFHFNKQVDVLLSRQQDVETRVTLSSFKEKNGPERFQLQSVNQATGDNLVALELLARECR